MYFDKYDNEINGCCIDDENDSFGNYDSLFGLGNQQKRAERKIKKAEKKLAKGKIKKAEKKLSKGTAILNKLQATQQKTIAAKQQVGDVNATKDYIKAFVPAQTESMQTTAGQIGGEAGATVVPSDLAQKQTLGGSAGDITYSGGGGSMDDLSSTLTGGEGETSTIDNPKELSGVTVTAKKPNWILYAGIAIAVIVVIFVIAKMNKKK